MHIINSNYMTTRFYKNRGIVEIRKQEIKTFFSLEYRKYITFYIASARTVYALRNRMYMPVKETFRPLAILFIFWPTGAYNRQSDKTECMPICQISITYVHTHGCSKLQNNRANGARLT
ncbi:hypothetical protein SAY87_024051 [Trapa incisa]|uniref:Uncharacterized protein n=1 Tax=Trapa incisa TaxID=236973 RepID=A0AAN7QUB0_9MYRT|nr:hypothetical protein SAY87_024051 [Trapa incisa]